MWIKAVLHDNNGMCNVIARIENQDTNATIQIDVESSDDMLFLRGPRIRCRGRNIAIDIPDILIFKWLIVK